MRARNALVLLLVIAVTPLGHVRADAGSRREFVRATQQMISTGAAPNVQGNVNPTRVNLTA
jgi:hypothetical protein